MRESLLDHGYRNLLKAFPYAQAILTQSSNAKTQKFRLPKNGRFSLGRNNNCLSSPKSESHEGRLSISCPFKNFSHSSNCADVEIFNKEDDVINPYNQQQHSRNNNNPAQAIIYPSISSTKTDNIAPYLNVSNNHAHSLYSGLANHAEINNNINSYNIPPFINPPVPPYSDYIEQYTLPVPYENSFFNPDVAISPPSFLDALRIPASDIETRALLARNLSLQSKRMYKNEDPKVYSDTIGTQTSRVVAFETSEKIDTKPDNSSLPVTLVGNNVFDCEKDGPYVLVPAKEYIKTSSSTPAVYVLPAILHAVSNDNPIEQLMDVVKDFNPIQSQSLPRDLSDFKHIACFPQTNKLSKQPNRFGICHDSLNSFNFLGSQPSFSKYLFGNDDSFRFSEPNVIANSNIKMSRNSINRSDDSLKKEKLGKKSSILKKPSLTDDKDIEKKSLPETISSTSSSSSSSKNPSLTLQTSSSQSSQSVKNIDPNSSSNNGAYDYYYPNSNYGPFNIY